MDEVAMNTTTFDSTVIAAVIGILAFALSQVLNALFVHLRDEKLKRLENLNIASFAKAELINVVRHHEANITKLDSIIQTGTFEVDTHYEKMKLNDNGLVALELAKIYVLPEGLTQDLLRFSLFCRNNEIEIKQTESIIEGNGNDCTKLACLRELRKRFERAILVAGLISENLDKYSNCQKNTNDLSINWPDEYWMLSDENDTP
ncbi:hypothetical protein TUMSATVNIG1_57510 (plasmid) [Vibrio nigripulchritudo]|uniref:hypothetical protein n=1 Tax=Vibrio nigripulchritudo TaxID=28173 RepID=UPI00190E040A|nr:hypothetical protein [Vibrio nigripulchritudo]BCL73765.1 hypothetical protein VNTUMSATTG_57020 [Vibrio nigripulchritudo]BDU35142.1 hypothetical protein TUMSATVNIG1_57510 [Vibrio nigripulchritudo]